LPGLNRFIGSRACSTACVAGTSERTQSRERASCCSTCCGRSCCRYRSSSASSGRDLRLGLPVRRPAHPPEFVGSLRLVVGHPRRRRLPGPVVPRPAAYRRRHRPPRPRRRPPHPRQHPQERPPQPAQAPTDGRYSRPQGTHEADEAAGHDAANHHPVTQCDGTQVAPT
jgi:hypothetical protein